MGGESTVTRVGQLVRRWQALRESGHEPTPQDLCADCPELVDELARRIESLREQARLQTTAEAEGSTRAGGGPADPESPHASVACVARYDDLQFHAEGGLGEVYRGRATDLNREVALKFLKPRVGDDGDLVRRFLREAEITGRLEHPGVVPVYGLGTDADGRPCYVMRFIRGRTLEEAVAEFDAAWSEVRDPAERAVAFRNLLRRIVAVCNTVAYAHSRGIVHRDLKPRNIMLGPYDETLVVDWGLARPIDPKEAGVDTDEEPLQPSGDSASMPETVGVVGTPAYMSPEQARGARVGPAGDVYSLGATLYFLLTGRPPFEGAAPQERLERVRRGDFPPPRAARPDVDRALEAICLKAMALQPEDRYPTPLTLADDLERWLADERVSAYREPAATRARRWLRRHRTVGASAATASLAAVGAMAVGLILLDRERDRTDVQRRAAVTAQGRAEARLQSALDAHRALVFEVQEQLGDAPGHRALRRALLGRASQGLEALIADVGAASEAGHGLSWAQVQAGDLALLLGDLERAAACYDRAQRAADHLLRASPDDPQARRDVAATLTRLGNLALRRGRTREARDLYDRAARLYPSASPADPVALREQATTLIKLGQASLTLGDVPAARAAFEAAVGLVPADDPGVATRRIRLGALQNLGDAQLQQGDLAGARDRYRQGLAVAELIHQSDPQSPRSARDVGILCSKLGDAARLSGRPDEARAYLLRDLALTEPRHRSDPSNLETRRDLSIVLNKLGDLALEASEADSARSYFERALAHAEAIVLAAPGDARARRDLAVSTLKIADVAYEQGDLPGSRRLYEKSLALRRELLAARPDDVEARRDLSLALERLGDVADREGEADAARALYDESRAHAERNALDAPGDVTCQTDLVFAYAKAGEFERAHGRADAARHWLELALARLDTLDASVSLRDQPGLADLRRQVQALLDQIRPAAPDGRLDDPRGSGLPFGTDGAAPTQDQG